MTRSKPYQLSKKKFLTKEEKASVLGAIATAPLREWLLVRLPLDTGARAQEILNIKVEDLDFDERGVQIYGLKGSNDRFIPLPEDTFTRLTEYVKDMAPDDLLFPITYRWHLVIWQKYAPKAIHSARHTFGLEMYERTKDIRLVKALLGHTNIMNTMIYADYAYTRSEMRKVMEGVA